MPFLRNAWYVTAWSEALIKDPIRITILGEPVAIFRNDEGEAVALGDVCPHRFASLSQGKIHGDTLECPYHGLRFDRSGACVHNPHGDGVVPPGARVRSFPLIERHHAIWIWPGDPALAEPASIPDFSVYDRSDIVSSRDYLHVDAHYELINDNLLDLSHAAFLHPFLTTEGFAGRSRAKVEQDGRAVHSYLWNDDEPLTPLFRLVWDGDGDRVDMRSHMHWTAPSNLFLDVGITEVGGEPEDGPWLPSAHLLTPETETSTHYFWMVGRNRQPENDELGGILHNGIKQAFETEDEPMIARVAANMAGRDFWSLRPAILAGDAAAVRARRMLAKLIREEDQPVAQAAE
ncbi:aromatic ring-hydroxylating dioxygenase subunit alpha [Sphingomonas sp. CGMCC 1.13654]|uniref:Aromatic ring-hydroxylating dioxygenase subunit alpha n=1 Tax=Sphingomonas chungangi TaxID=2683589 RepID=A0A838L1X1_9SPHN|nr:aromatic ring-hydroxylating dioxygenase subunit alpha [Sphingomonas chungangi]MBA2933493.1 aromatic ring-hydroxylating dioxygenase subunit alpha [Sphingomonas chungangi]MVW54826.1 Rieske 2Fe-2S domain-containing protein [Sphingomonas chungangi]